MKEIGINNEIREIIYELYDLCTIQISQYVYIPNYTIRNTKYYIVDRTIRHIIHIS